MNGVVAGGFIEPPPGMFGEAINGRGADTPPPNLVWNPFAPPSAPDGPQFQAPAAPPVPDAGPPAPAPASTPAAGSGITPTPPMPAGDAYLSGPRIVVHARSAGQAAAAPESFQLGAPPAVPQADGVAAIRPIVPAAEPPMPSLPRISSPGQPAPSVPASPPNPQAPQAPQATGGTAAAATGEVPRGARPVERSLPEWSLVLADGVIVPLYGSVVVGRNPAGDQFPDATLAAVPDPTRTMSKTHARFYVDDGVLMVDDLGSTNGIALFPGGTTHGAMAVEPGLPVQVRSGDVVQLGEYDVTIRRN